MNNNISTRALLVRLTVQSYGGEKIDNELSDALTTTADAQQGAGSFRKKLVPPAQINKLKAAARRAYYQHKKLTLPWGNNGQRILSVDSYFEYLDALADVEGKWQATVDEFLQHYNPDDPELIARMGTLYDRNDYPSPAQLAQRFNFDLQFAPVPSAGDFRIGLDDAIVKQLGENLQAETNQRVGEATQAMTQELVELLAELSQGVEGKETGITPGVMRKAQYLADRIDRFNFTDDPKLSEAAQRLRGVEQGAVTPSQRHEYSELHARYAAHAQANPFGGM